MTPSEPAVAIIGVVRELMWSSSRPHDSRTPPLPVLHLVVIEEDALVAFLVELTGLVPFGQSVKWTSSREDGGVRTSRQGDPELARRRRSETPGCDDEFAAGAAVVERSCGPYGGLDESRNEDDVLVLEPDAEMAISEVAPAGEVGAHVSTNVHAAVERSLVPRSTQYQQRTRFFVALVS